MSVLLAFGFGMSVGAVLTALTALAGLRRRLRNLDDQRLVLDVMRAELLAKRAELAAMTDAAVLAGAIDANHRAALALRRSLHLLDNARRAGDQP